MVLCVRNLSLYYMQIVYAKWINRKPYQRLRIRVGIIMIIKPIILSLPKQISAKAVLALFFARQQSGLGTWENASHFALVFDLVYRRMDSRRPVEFRVCRRFTRRVHIRSRVRVGVSCTLCAQTWYFRLQSRTAYGHVVWEAHQRRRRDRWNWSSIIQCRGCLETGFPLMNSCTNLPLRCIIFAWIFTLTGDETRRRLDIGPASQTSATLFRCRADAGEDETTWLTCSQPVCGAEKKPNLTRRRPCGSRLSSNFNSEVPRNWTAPATWKTTRFCPNRWGVSTTPY